MTRCPLPDQLEPAVLHGRVDRLVHRHDRDVLPRLREATREGASDRATSHHEKTRARNGGCHAGRTLAAATPKASLGAWSRSRDEACSARAFPPATAYFQGFDARLGRGEHGASGLRLGPELTRDDHVLKLMATLDIQRKVFAFGCNNDHQQSKHGLINGTTWSVVV